MPWNRFVAMERFSSLPSSVLWFRSAPVCYGGLNRSDRAEPIRVRPLTWDTGMQEGGYTGGGPGCTETGSMAAAADRHRLRLTPALPLLSAAVRDDSVPPPLSLSLSLCLCLSRSTVSLLPGFCLTLPQIQLTFLSLLSYDNGCQTCDQWPDSGSHRSSSAHRMALEIVRVVIKKI